jgi:hypothetical protein
MDAPPFTTFTVMGPAAARGRVEKRRRGEGLRTAEKAAGLLRVVDVAAKACMVSSVVEGARRRVARRSSRRLVQARIFGDLE